MTTQLQLVIMMMMMMMAVIIIIIIISAVHMRFPNLEVWNKYVSQITESTVTGAATDLCNPIMR
jgi:hypothetical protein